jgi:hypothetical protein
MEHSDSEEEKLIWTAAIMYAGGEASFECGFKNKM